MKRLLCVWLPNWPIQRLLAESQTDSDDEEPEGKPAIPIVLWREDPRRGRLVVACCRQARRQGVRVAMPIAQANAMVREGQLASATARIERHDLDLDYQSLQRVAFLLQQRITPLVAIEALGEKPWEGHPRHQSESLLCDISGAAHLFGGESGLLRATAEALTTVGLSGWMAIADTVGAAWALAHYSREMTAFGTSRYLAATEDLRASVEPLPVESLRIVPETVATLSRLGVERVEQLLQLPRSGLATRLGSHLVHRIEQALGEIDEPLGVYRAPAEHSATLTLEYPTSDQKILTDRVERLIKKVRAGLAACQRGALRMACHLDLAAHPPLTFKIGLFAPTADAEHLSGLVLNRLESKKLPSCVQRVTISVTLSGPLRSAQTSLFDSELCDLDSSVCMSGSEISRLVDSLSGRLGRDAVVGVTIEDDPLPEKAFSVLPLTAGSVSPDLRSRHSAKSSRSSPRKLVSSAQLLQPHPVNGEPTDSVSSQPSPEDAMRRPLSLIQEPIPLAVAFENGPFHRSVSSPKLPSRIRVDGVTHLVIRHWGPERIETGWWKGPSIRRDYYRIETDRGRWWWIFRNLVSKTQVSDTRYHWMLHGRFA